MAERRPKRPADFLDEATIFHVTHYKAGSRWIYRILRHCVGPRLLTVRPGREQLLYEPIEPGRVYSACYATREEVEGLHVPPDTHRFFILRDLRDTLVSAYFSVKISHPTFKFESVNRLRERLRWANQEEGMLLALREWLPVAADIQRSWLHSGDALVRYEDLLVDPEPILGEVLLRKCELGISRVKLREALAAESFESLSGGRKPGEEDISDHYRKGVAGDWRNHFSARVTEEFKHAYGDLLIAAGYETNGDW
jgi:sulfotransferase family protein